MLSPLEHVGRHRVREVPVAPPVEERGVGAPEHLGLAFHPRPVLGLGLGTGRHHVLEADPVGETSGALPREQEVRRAVHHGARHQDRIAHALDHRDRSEAALAGHERGIHLDGLAVEPDVRAGAGIEARVVLEMDGSRDRAIHARSSREHDAERRIGRALGPVGDRGRRADTAVDDDERAGSRASGERGLTRRLGAGTVRTRGDCHEKGESMSRNESETHGCILHGLPGPPPVELRNLFLARPGSAAS